MDNKIKGTKCVVTKKEGKRVGSKVAQRRKMKDGNWKLVNVMGKKKKKKKRQSKMEASSFQVWNKVTIDK